MGRLKSLKYRALDLDNPEEVIQSVEVLHLCFPGNERYSVDRLVSELKGSPEIFYRQFFVATITEETRNRVVGIAGIKAADWATDFE